MSLLIPRNSLNIEELTTYAAELDKEIQSLAPWVITLFNQRTMVARLIDFHAQSQGVQS